MFVVVVVVGFIKYTTEGCHINLLPSEDVYLSASHLKTQAHQFSQTQ